MARRLEFQEMAERKAVRGSLQRLKDRHPARDIRERTFRTT